VSAGTWVTGSLLGVALAGAYAAQMVRWLRVLQREHYEPSSMRRFLGRWSTPQVASAKSPERSGDRRPITLTHVLVVVLVAATVIRVDDFVVLVTVVYGVFCPRGLAMKGRTSKLQWTRRLTLIALDATVLSVAIGLAGLFTTRPWLVFVAMVWAVPVMLDVTSRLLAPYERHHSQKFVDQAVARLAKVQPRIVAITGSYGKTSTKNHLAVARHQRESGGRHACLHRRDGYLRTWRDPRTVLVVSTRVGRGDRDRTRAPGANEDTGCD
jgi:UDP-N-acetylmuramoyl-tripeptide--D-alanyl-D-alanine ligase